ncbi:hypothetical protein V6N13_097731 [Hibiscus sabdariffa]|uniref:Uncharacterized protein n=1 Tax=Hibiscus sabdariffa TaxID=183260 RepID=A0ABR2CAJ7_9ROSI
MNAQMVHFKTLFPPLLFFLLIFASSTAAGSASATGVVGSFGQRDHGAKSHRMNHGSFRGPRKHLLNPAVEHPLQLPKLTV